MDACSKGRTKMNSEMDAPEIEMDDDGYPTEESLTALKLWLDKAPLDQLGKYLLGPFLKFADICDYVTIDQEITQHEIKEFGPKRSVITFHTGGWSGAESYLDVILSCMFLKMFYYDGWRRGGHHTFVVSLEE